MLYNFFKKHFSYKIASLYYYYTLSMVYLVIGALFNRLFHNFIITIIAVLLVFPSIMCFNQLTEGARPSYFRSSGYYIYYRIRLVLFSHYYYKNILKNYHILKSDNNSLDGDAITNAPLYNLNNDIYWYIATISYKLDEIISIYYQTLTDLNRIDGYTHVYCKLQNNNRSPNFPIMLRDLKIFIINNSYSKVFLENLVKIELMTDKKRTKAQIISDFYEGLPPEYQLGVMI